MAVLVDVAADRPPDLGAGPLAESLLGIGRDVLGDAQPPRSVELHAARTPQRRELLAVIWAHRRVAFHAMAERTREVGAVGHLVARGRCCDRLFDPRTPRPPAPEGVRRILP